MTLLPRAKRYHYLSLILSAFLAWPANLPIGVGEPTRADRDLDGPSYLTRDPGHGFRRPDRKSPSHPADWSVDVDNSEGSDGRDDLRFVPLAIPHQRLDLPSLIPSPLESRPAGPVDPMAASPDRTPLRC